MKKNYTYTYRDVEVVRVTDEVTNDAGVPSPADTEEYLLWLNQVLGLVVVILMLATLSSLLRLWVTLLGLDHLDVRYLIVHNVSTPIIFRSAPAVPPQGMTYQVSTDVRSGTA